MDERLSNSQVPLNLGPNLLRLRRARGLTQMELAEMAGLSRVSYVHIENGAAFPKPETIRGLAKALGVRHQALFDPPGGLTVVRFRSLKRLRSREQILVDVARRLGNYDELERLLGLSTPYTFANKCAATDPPGLAQEVRDRMRVSRKEAVSDVCGLLEGAGVKILTYPFASADAFFGLSVAQSDGGPAIVVNTWSRISVERWIFTAAHELGHLLLHLSSFDVEEDAEPREEETQANQFASHFLMPEMAFREEWEEGYGQPFIDRVLKIKRVFRVSYKTVLYRAIESGVADSGVWKRFQVEHARRYGRTLLKADEPKPLRADAFRGSTPEPAKAREPESLSSVDFTEDRLYFLVRKAVELKAINLKRGAEILGVAPEEMKAIQDSWV